MRFVLPLLFVVSPIVAGAQIQPGAGQASLSPEELVAMQWKAVNQNEMRANVDGAIVTNFEVQKRVRVGLPSLQRQARGNTEELMRELEKREREALEGAAMDQLWIAAFKEKYHKVPEEYVAAAVERHIQDVYNGDRDAYYADLSMMGMTPLDGKKRQEENLMVSWIVAELVKYPKEFSPVAVQRYYDENKASFSQEESFLFRQMTLRPGASETDEMVRKLAEEISVQLKSGADFGELARKHSRDDLRNEGGLNQAWKSATGMNERIVEALRTLPNGGTTEPMDFSQPGMPPMIFILQRMDYRAGGPRPIEEVRGVIEEKLGENAGRQAYEAAAARLKEKYFVRYY